MKNVLVVGANCAWQKVLLFANFQSAKINRAEKIYQFASGKGINFARAMKNYDKCEPHLIQFSGGDAGDKILKNLVLENINCFNVVAPHIFYGEDSVFIYHIASRIPLLGQGN